MSNIFDKSYNNLEESFALMEQDIPAIKEGVLALINQNRPQRIFLELIKLKGLGEHDSFHSTCVETKIPIAFEETSLYEYTCEFVVNLSSWSTDNTGYNPTWQFDISLDGFNIGANQEILIQHLNFEVSRNTNDPQNVTCIGSFYKKPSYHNLALQVTALENTSQNKPNSYIGTGFITVKFHSTKPLL